MKYRILKNELAIKTKIKGAFKAASTQKWLIVQLKIHSCLRMLSKLCIRIVASMSKLKLKFNCRVSFGCKFMTLFIYRVFFRTFPFQILTYNKEMKAQSKVYISLGKTSSVVHEIVVKLPDNARKIERL